MAQIQGFILLALREFPEVLFLGLFNDSGDIDSGFASCSGLGEFGSLATYRFSDVQLRQRHLEVLLFAARVSGP